LFAYESTIDIEGSFFDQFEKAGIVTDLIRHL
jgi:hypothetical protein